VFLVGVVNDRGEPYCLITRCVYFSSPLFSCAIVLHALLILMIKNDQLVSTLTSLYTDDNNEIYDGHAAFKHNDSIYMDTNTNGKAEAKKTEIYS